MPTSTPRRDALKLLQLIDGLEANTPNKKLCARYNTACAAHKIGGQHHKRQDLHPRTILASLQTHKSKWGLTAGDFNR